MAQKDLGSTAIPWIKVTDLEEGECWLTIQNSTTLARTKAHDPIELTELGERGMSVRIPSTLCALGHHLSIEIRLKKRNPVVPPGPDAILLSLLVTARVSSEEKFDDASKVVELQFYQFVEEEWRRFLRYFADKQSAAAAILKRMNE